MLAADVRTDEEADQHYLAIKLPLELLPRFMLPVFALQYDLLPTY